MDQQVKKKWYKRWWAIVLFGVIAVVFISSIGDEPTTSTPSNIVRVGEEGYLRVSGEIVTVARTKESYDEFTQSMYAKDTYGMAKLVADGKAFNVPVGTKVLVIDQAVGDRKVRILEGSHANEDGWVVKEFISKQ
jgi:hypothetical protein